MGIVRRIAGSLTSFKIVRDILTLQAGAAVGLGVSLIGSIVYARMLGLDGYGQYAAALAFSGTASALINLGQASSFTTFLAEQYGKKSAQGMARATGYYLLISFCTAVPLLAVAWFAPVLCAKWYGSTEIGVLARLATLLVILNTIPGLFLGLLQTVRKMRLYVAFDQGTSLVHLAASVYLLTHGGDASSILLSRIVIQILSIPFLLAAVRSLKKETTMPRMRELVTLHGPTLREYISQGLWIGIDKNVYNLFPNGLLTILRVYSSDAVVGLARIVFQLAQVPRSLLLNQTMQMSVTVLPTMAGAGKTVLRKAAVTLVKHATFFHAGISLVCLIAMPPAVLLFYGLPYADAIEPALWLMLISMIPALAVANAPLLRLMRKTWISTAGNLAALAVAVGLLFTLRDTFAPMTTLLIATAVYYASQQIVTLIVYLKLLGTQPTFKTETVIDVTPREELR